jgi:hypothetical protein
MKEEMEKVKSKILQTIGDIAECCNMLKTCEKGIEIWDLATANLNERKGYYELKNRLQQCDNEANNNAQFCMS